MRRRAGWSLCLLALTACARTDVADRSEFRAGTAKAKITPQESLMLAGYGARNKPAEGTAADLWARALALETSEGQKVVVVTGDIIGFGPKISQRIKAQAKKQFGLSEGRILLVGSHTHSGPVIRERALVDHPEQVSDQDAYADFLSGEVLRIIGEALGNVAPARLSFARGEARFGMNRRVKHPDGTWRFGKNPEGESDPDVPVLKVATPEGQLHAVLFTYACHCTSVRNNFEGFYKYHPDWNICSAELEKKNPGALFMFITGCGGDIDPQPTGGIDKAEEHGREMMASLEAVLGGGRFTPVSGRVRTKYLRIDLPLEKPSRETFEKLAATGKGGDQKFAQEMLKKLDAGTAPTSISYPILVWRFGGDVTLVALAGETCVDYALRLKRELGKGSVPFVGGSQEAVARALLPNFWVAGYSNEVMCYIPSERVLNEGGYEAGWHISTGRGFASMQMAWSGWITPFAAGVEDRIVSAVREMLKE